jgi:hypothetical protein
VGRKKELTGRHIPQSAIAQHTITHFFGGISRYEPRPSFHAGRSPADYSGASHIRHRSKLVSQLNPAVAAP